MKKIIFTIIAATLVLCGCSKSKQFKVALSLDNAENKSVYLCKTVDGEMLCIDSAVIENKQAVFYADVDDPQMLYTIKYNLNDNCGVFTFFSENNDMTISGDFNSMQLWKISGCRTMEELVAHHEKCMELYENKMLDLYANMENAYMANDTVQAAEIDTVLKSLMKDYYNYQAEFIRSHSDSYLAHYLLDSFKQDFDIEVVKELAAGLTNESVFRNNVKKYIEEYQPGRAPSCCGM
ncbi:MAG: DUF4369 domain-containing protein [Bacteroidales bacterium]|nr:DUF4369 domain-containing protein [Bacteroidales bacterium]